MTQGGYFPGPQLRTAPRVDARCYHKKKKRKEKYAETKGLAAVEQNPPYTKIDSVRVVQ